MSTFVSISIIVACFCILLLTILTIVVGYQLWKRFGLIEKQIASLHAEVTEFVREGRGVYALATEVLSRANSPIDDIQYVTRTARGWVARMDGLLGGVEKAVEPSLFLFSNKLRNIRAFATGVLQSFTNHRQH